MCSCQPCKCTSVVPHSIVLEGLYHSLDAPVHLSIHCTGNLQGRIREVHPHRGRAQVCQNSICSTLYVSSTVVL